MEHEQHHTDDEEAFIRHINNAIDTAWSEQRPIDDATARRIAESIEPGSGALHDFTETGAIADDIEVELTVAYDIDPARETWLDALEHYCHSRASRDPIPGWGEESNE